MVAQAISMGFSYGQATGQLRMAASNYRARSCTRYLGVGGFYLAAANICALVRRCRKSVPAQSSGTK